MKRLRIARTASLIGGGALVLAVVGLVASSDATPFVLIMAAAGFIGIGTWAALAPDDFRATLRGRRAAFGINNALILLLFVGIMVLVYFLSARASIAVDFTNLGYYRLKDATRPAVEGLSRPTQITAFYNRQRLGQQSAESPILRLFVDAAPDKIRLIYVDPDEQPILARQFGVTGGFGIFVSYLTPEGNPDPRFTVQMRPDADFVNERWVAEALLQLQARGKYNIVFTTGGGEINLDTDATGIRDGLRSVGINVSTVDLTQADIPAQTTLLVILAPLRDFSQAETDKIAAYLAGGGKLLIMAEPAYQSAVRFMQAADSPLAEYLWKAWGIKPERAIVFDPVSFYETQYYVQPAKFADQHPIVRKDASGTPARPLFNLAQSWAVAPTLPDGVQVSLLYTTSDQAFGKTDLREVASNPNRAVRGALDIAGPLTLAVAAENKSTGARIVAVGDADWITNDLIVAFDGQVLWTNMIDWLTQFLERINIDPVFERLPLNVTQNELNIAAFITLVLLPGMVLVVGVVVWLRRRAA